MAPTEGKSRKPANTAFKQQRLKAWQPILTPKTVLPTLFIVGIIFAPLGGLLLYASNTVSEIEIDYTNCDSQAPADFGPMPSDLVKISFASSNGGSNSPQWRAVDAQTEYGFQAKRCTIMYSIPARLKGPIYMYYRLTNFYQNHRRYVKSFDAKQLQGEAVPVATLDAGNCKPLASLNGKAIYPCGLIANSIFNDTIYDPILHSADGSNTTEVKFTTAGTAWPSDHQKYGQTKYNVTDIVPPPNWVLRFPNGYNETNIANITDEPFQVWMRTAGLPDFRKLYAKTGEAFEVGTYQIDVDSLFPVTVYGGRKSIVFSTVSFLGGKNPFLGIAYVAVGVLCVILGSVFTAKHLLKPRQLGDHKKLSWNQNSKNPKGSGGQ
ncbi:537_t:CDS:2 [Paraglomus brasilianum]|uniref:537_t:CDS:1 n=1 Tax=Paraglomus brasilianum TaxID=144538 RepID=A0A9N9B8U1_9GLOM|nr:537_t:CDS:2 [Paraglomus brasilianum]